MTITRRGDIPLYAQIRDVLGEEISYMEPGEVISTEPELEERFGVSRITVRRAIEALVNEGVLVRQQGRGTFVQSPKLTHELDNITSWTEQLKALGYKPGTTHVHCETLAPPGRIAHMLQLQEERVVRLRRLRLADGEPISLMFNYLPAHLVPDLIGSGSAYESLYEHLQTQYGLVPAEAIDTVETREATEQEAELLEIQPWSPVICVTRISYLTDGSPLEVALATSRGDRYQYKVMLSGRSKLLERGMQ